MYEINSLEISNVSPNIITPQTNRKGRPKKARNKIFGPQPKSMIITQIIKEMQAEMSVNNPRNETISLEDSEEDIAEVGPVELTPQNIHQVSPKRTIDNKELSKAQAKANYHQYSCDYPECSYTCKLSCNLIKHKRIHTSEKPYLCDQCSFRSNYVNSLKAHKRTHTSERPYACEHCPHRCNSSSNLKKHCLHKHPEVPKT